MIDGYCINKGYSDSYGNYVHIMLSNSTYISYNHLNKVTVNIGDFVKAGEIIGKTGNTGNSTAPHLHLSIFVNDEPKDILNLVKYDYTSSFIEEYSERGEPFIYENSNK